LERHPKAHGQVILLQVAPVSRGSIESYRNFRQELDREAARVNGRFARFDWTPVHYLNRALPRRTLAGLYRASRVGIVTPMRDGMNLVAMEYIAAQEPADPGVLVLSRFAGAAQYLREALLVNPYDGEETAEAMHIAREMRVQERRRRHEALMKRLAARDVGRWRRDFVGALLDAPAGTRRARAAR
ncbi:MAG: trehalose-6-phosphate synthase, partial [Steroidobacteraceae bacterium]